MSEHQVPNDANNGPWATPICGAVAWGADIALVCDGEIVMASYNEHRIRACGSAVSWAARAKEHARKHASHVAEQPVRVLVNAFARPDR